MLFFMRRPGLLRFRLRSEIIDWNDPAQIVSFRERCESGAVRFGKVPAALTVEPADVGGIPAEWIVPPHGKRDKMIFFLHGGGYVSGSRSDHRMHVAKLVLGSQTAALLFEYRLAPEHPYPAALDDSVAAYRRLLARGILPENVVFAGDSAGGGLCLAVMLELKDKKIPLPAAAVALSPWTDLKCTGDSYRINAQRCLSPRGCWTAFSRHYAGSNDPGLPGMSPLYGDLHGLPPLLIYAGDDEILRDDSVRFAEKAKQAGVDVTLEVGRGMFHCYPVCAPMFPEATRAMDHICGFIKQHLG
jgi:acetyl esterase/lipase